MKKETLSPALRVGALLAYLVMIAVNLLANILPLNGVTTGEVSSSYPNLFTPAPFTFAIWGLIYLLLLGYTLFQLGFFRGGKPVFDRQLEVINILYIISCLSNAAWIFAWHYNVIWLSVIFMLVILACLILINQRLCEAGLTPRERLFAAMPFGLYIGWITVATIANITVFLVSIKWDGFGISEAAWTVIMLLAGAAIGLSVLLKCKNAAFGLALIWAYFGILVEHVSESGYGGLYPSVITTASICIGVFASALVFLFGSRFRS